MTRDQTSDERADDAPQMPEGRGYKMRGTGATHVAISRQELWRIVTDPERLAAAIPGADTLRQTSSAPRTYVADVGIGVGRLKGTYVVSAEFADEQEPDFIVLLGGAKGPFGRSNGEGWVNLVDAPGGGTTVHYTYAILIQGAVAVAGGRLLDAAADMLIGKFFDRLAGAVNAGKAAAGD